MTTKEEHKNKLVQSRREGASEEAGASEQAAVEEVPRVVGAELEQMRQSGQGWKGHSGPRPQHVQRPAGVLSWKPSIGYRDK